MSDHNWWQWNGLTCCKTCGIVQRRDGKNRPCKGPTKVEVRRELGEFTPGSIYFSHTIRGIECDVQAAKFCDGVPDYLTAIDENTGELLDLTDEEYEALSVAAQQVYCNRGTDEPPFDPLDYCPGGIDAG